MKSFARLHRLSGFSRLPSLPRLLLLLLTLLQVPPALGADIQVLGLLRDMAIVRIDGKQHTLRVGQSTPQGIRLIAANSTVAVLEIDGKRQEFGLGSHVSTAFAAPDTTRVLIRPTNGMYTVRGFINRQPVDFLVDTGASFIAMNSNVARRLGINYRYEGTPGWVSTASGREQVYRIRLATVQVGEIVLQNVDAAVLEGNSPTSTLLGMSFLNQVKMRHEGKLLLLEK